MKKLAENGTAIVMASSELPEIIGMSDRVIVMHEGAISGEFARGEITQEAIMRKASGGNAA
jgi:ribose transport system ATP-binding protein